MGGSKPKVHTVAGKEVQVKIAVVCGEARDPTAMVVKALRAYADAIEYSGGYLAETTINVEELTRSPLSPGQAKVLEFLKTYINENGRAPTLREIGKALDIKSTNGVSDHLKCLQRKGYITNVGTTARAIQIV